MGRQINPCERPRWPHRPAIPARALSSVAHASEAGYREQIVVAVQPERADRDGMKHTRKSTPKQRKIGWAFTMNPTKWGVYFQRVTESPIVWRLNIGPLHLVRIK